MSARRWLYWPQSRHAWIGANDDTGSGEKWGGYRQLSYIHLLSTLEKAAIDAGVNVPKLLDDSEVGAEAVNTITDL